jgi:hypothetical protein
VDDRKVVDMGKGTCSEDGCERPAEKVGLCGMHYSRLRRYGDLSRGRLTPADRFWLKVNKDGPIPPHVRHLGRCWEWTDELWSRGYGRLRVGRRHLMAHRVAWEIHFGEIPNETPFVLHNCDNRACVNAPGGHLRLGTHQDNMDDMVARKRSRPRPRILQPCGTAAAYRRHLLLGEVTCEPCRAAYLAYLRGLPRRAGK